MSNRSQSVEEIQRELIRFGANPYVLAADLCAILYEASKQRVSYRQIAAGFDSFVKSIEKDVVALHEAYFDKTARDPDHRFVRHELHETLEFELDKDKPLEIKAFTLLDDYRRFFKVFGLYLNSFESLAEFSEDPFLSWMLYDKRSQIGLKVVARSRSGEGSQIDRGLEVIPHTPTQQVKIENLKARVRASIAKVLMVPGTPAARYDADEKLLKALHRDVDQMDRVGNTWYAVVGSHYELWMESLATCSCALAILGRRHEETWNRVLELSEDRTQGIPSGVCAYKMAGDVYRRTSRMIRERDVRLFAGNARKADVDADIIQRVKSPLLFKLDGCTDDLTPMPYRQIGSAFFALQLVNFLAMSVEEGKATRTVNFRAHYIFSAGVLKAGGFQSCRWIDGLPVDDKLCPLNIYVFNQDGDEYIQSVMGMDEGVYSLFGTELLEVPYTMRKTSDDYHRSFRQVMTRLLKQPGARKRLTKLQMTRKNGKVWVRLDMPQDQQPPSP